MVAELQLTDPLLELAAGGVLELGVSRSESHIFKSSHTPSLLRGAGLFPYENSLSFFAMYQLIFSAKNPDVVQIQLMAIFWVMKYQVQGYCQWQVPEVDQSLSVAI